MRAGGRLTLRLAIAIAVGLAVALATGLRVFEPVSGRAFDLLSSVAPAHPPQPGAVLVTIDEPSFSALGRPWPWPRDTHAQLIRALRQAGAKAIAFDVVFAEPSDPTADAALAAAAGADTLFAADETVSEQGYGSTVIRTEPIAELLAGGAQSGVASLSMDGDGVLRRIPRYPDSFAARIARMTGAPGEAGQGGRLIQYFGPAGSYPRVSYYQALEPAKYLPPDLLKGRIVIVGLALQTSPEAGKRGVDAFETPWTLTTRQLSPGLEVQATLYDNLVHGLGIRVAPLPVSLFFVLTSTLLGWLATRPQAPLAKAGLTIGAVLSGIMAAWMMLRFGRIWVSPVEPAVTLALQAIALSAYDFAAEQRRRRETQAAFSQYVAPAVVERLIANPELLNLGGETKDLTIMFADIRGFTGISEAMKDDPQALTRMINGILTPLSEIIMARGGTIDKYMGDCVMAFWGAPLDDADHARHAVDAAMAMLAAMPTINDTLRAAAPDRDLPPVRIGIGVNSGTCVVGNMGSEKRFDYSVLGDAVNIASRLEGLCKTYEVELVVGEATARALTDVDLVELDRIAVRGKRETQAIYTAKALRELSDG
ncbi:MAG: CHASE2 domain-containing protein [Alphaproteobacteria bacterium]|nr:CHASE2 domain-containing protein [Alphaproteobacteria bacterium]MBU1512926.1 CHASE2 domain-containing protein [Alphaproteobacteria bacterium]MBU2096633.1 CHASE2 domain-containing protein [Alphaproteobacteria bacterium]MBU2150516.1 CHASE2 domain-containing protein [Alphaproteobacteria bacterium]MBU2306555.1 CHASE2 domain-containing protein [Alphaproteobacteria bacterium]